MSGMRLGWWRRRVIDTVRYEGVGVLASRMMRTALSPVAEMLVYSYFTKDLGPPVELHTAKIDVDIGPLPADDIGQVVPVIFESYHPARRATESLATVEAMVRARYAAGARCFVARLEGCIVHYNWVFVSTYDGEEAAIVIGEGQAHCDNGFTDESARGMGVHAAVNSRMLEYLREHGVHTAYTRLTRDNVSSKKALLRVGWERMATLAVLSPRWSQRMYSVTLRGPLGPVTPRRQRLAVGPRVA